ncbi:hypothetical protein F5887DRAFT_952426 [Amanita rubescens]|nr:hypothetical protein F5887DRAFT_952426 [Amanita rubescens]
MNFTRLLVKAVSPSLTTHSSCCKKHWLHARYYSSLLPGENSDSKVSRPIINPNSIFTGDSAWDHMFSNLDDYKARSSPSRRELGHVKRVVKPPQSQRGSQSSRRQTMNAREMSAFDDVFNMIFDAASKEESAGGDKPSQGSIVGELFSSIPTSSRMKRWTTEEEVMLDRKKEEINLCASDLELLLWTQREVLDPFENMIQRQSSDTPQLSTAKKSVNEDNKPHPTNAPPSTPPSELHIQSYHYLVAYVMRTFRDKYRDPYLALALFSKVKNHSFVSYVFGCSTRVYNELIDTKWQWFRDVRGIHDAVEEMVVNGVGINQHTRSLVENVRHGVMERKAWAENMDVRSEEVLNLLMRLDHFITKSSSRKTKTPLWDKWKGESSSDKEEDEWGFNKWSGSGRRQEPANFAPVIVRRRRYLYRD